MEQLKSPVEAFSIIRLDHSDAISIPNYFYLLFQKYIGDSGYKWWTREEVEPGSPWLTDPATASGEKKGEGVHLKRSFLCNA